MLVHVTIERDGAVLETLTLGQGEHGIGRAPDNAVVLPDKAVSSRHALLRVTETEAELLDRESLNGIFVDGEKVGKIAVSRPVTADICGLRLVFTPQAPPKKRFDVPGPRFGTRPAVLLVTAGLALCVFLAAWLPARNTLSALTKREALQRGALLVRSLAAQNRVPLRAGLLDQLDTTAVAAEDGVRQAVVADPYGKVLAPAQDLGKILEDPQAREAAKGPGLRVWAGPEGDTVLACPIRGSQTLLGLALIVFKPELALPPTAWSGAGALGLLAALVFWAAAIWAILRLTLGPVRTAAEDIGVALKSGSRELALVPASREVAELKRAVERVLVLAPACAPGQGGPPPAPGAPAAGPAAAGQTPPSGQPAVAVPIDADDDNAWCLLDLASYRLTGWSPAFAPYLRAPDTAPPVHLLSALADAAVLAAVAATVDDPAGDAARQVENRRLTARKAPGPEPGTVRVRLTEAP